MPFGFIVAVITSFRLSDAFRKFERAAGLLTSMHSACRETTSRLCAYVTPGNEEALDLALQIRRLLVLGCVLIKEFVRGEKSDLLDEQRAGLLTAYERQLLVNTMCIVASDVSPPASPHSSARPRFPTSPRSKKGLDTIDQRPPSVPKKDRYPSKNRAAFAFQQVQLVHRPRCNAEA